MYGKAWTSSAEVLEHKGFDTLSLSPDANVRASEVPSPLFSKIKITIFNWVRTQYVALRIRAQPNYSKPSGVYLTNITK